MHNKKGFVFVETIVVISVVSIALISLFTLFYSVYNEEQKRLSFDNVEDLYATYFVKKYLEENNINRCFINYNSDDLFKEIENGSEHYRVYTVNVHRKTGGPFGELNLSASSFSDSAEIDKSINDNMTGVRVNYSGNGNDIQICSLGNCIDGSDLVSLSANFEPNIINGKKMGYKESLTFTITVSSSDKCTILHDNDDINGKSFNIMKDKFNIKNLYLVTGDITNLKLNKAKNLLSANVIDYIKTMSKNSSGYYLVSEFENNNVASVKLTTDISNTTALSILSANDSLMKGTTTDENGIINVYGDNLNNYVKFAGKDWRIIRINEDGSIRLILDKKLKPIKYDKIDYELNEFYDSLSSNSDYIVLSNYCVDDCDSIDCDNIDFSNFSYVCDNLTYYGQMSLSDVMGAGTRSFLTDIGSTGERFWIGAKKNGKFYYYAIGETYIPGKMGHAGEYIKILNGPQIPTNSTTAYIRPVISIKGSVVLTGDGSSKNPYQIKKE